LLPLYGQEFANRKTGGERMMVQCWRCKKERSIEDVMFVPLLDRWPFWKVKYFCGFCIMELAEYWGPKYAIKKEKSE
jgi:hypothetical protein